MMEVLSIIRMLLVDESCFLSGIFLSSSHRIVIFYTMQTIDTRIKLAYALAKQWFGVYITPETPNDGR